MNIKQMDNKVFEALFHQAVIDEYNEEIDGLPDKKELMKILKMLLSGVWKDMLRNY